MRSGDGDAAIVKQSWRTLIAEAELCERTEFQQQSSMHKEISVNIIYQHSYTNSECLPEYY